VFLYVTHLTTFSGISLLCHASAARTPQASPYHSKQPATAQPTAENRATRTTYGATEHGRRLRFAAVRDYAADCATHCTAQHFTGRAKHHCPNGRAGSTPNPTGSNVFVIATLCLGQDAKAAQTGTDNPYFHDDSSVSGSTFGFLGEYAFSHVRDDRGHDDAHAFSIFFRDNFFGMDPVHQWPCPIPHRLRHPHRRQSQRQQ
jgi:hypothetical protein